MEQLPAGELIDIAAIAADQDNHALPFWSPLKELNADGKRRKSADAKEGSFNIEIPTRMWSIWGDMHPKANCFHRLTRGKQYIACNVAACCAAHMYPLSEWNRDLLNTIVVVGDEYYRRSLAVHTSQPEHILELSELSHTFGFEGFLVKIRVKDVVYGKLFSARTRNKMNLPAALFYFFHKNDFGIVECANRSLAIGKFKSDGSFFMFDCMSKEHPLFKKDEGASYILRTTELPMLVFCIISTLEMPTDRLEFHVQSVKIKSCRPRSDLNLRNLGKPHLNHSNS